MNVIVTDEVYNRLAEIKKYIAKDSVQNANKVVDKILASFENIGIFPNSGTHLSNRIDCSNDLKYKIVYSYAVIYKIEGNNVVIATVLHLKRDFNRIKF